MIKCREDDHKLQYEEESIAEQISGLIILLETFHSEKKVMSSEQIYSMLRKQSVVRKRIQDLALQIKQVQEQRMELHKKIEKEQKKSNFWLRKNGNYQRWFTRMKSQHYQLQIQQEEAELEEII